MKHLRIARPFWWQRVARALALGVGGAVFVCLGFQPAEAAAACPPPLPAPSLRGAAVDHGFLWRITRDGHSSWLFGTLHVGKPAWARFGPKVTAALQASDTLALELDPGDPGLTQALADPGPPPVLPAALKERLQRAFDRACVDRQSLAGLHPLLQVTSLSVLEARWLGLDPAYAQEHLLLAAARAAGQPVVALETAALQKAALLPETPAEALTSLAQSLTELEDRSGRRVLDRMVRAWAQGDLATLADFERWCECAVTAEDRASMRRLNDERNPALADGIEARHKAGQRVFAAVGALHMTGAAGLPLLLARRGFEVERIAFNPASP